MNMGKRGRLVEAKAQRGERADVFLQASFPARSDFHRQTNIPEVRILVVQGSGPIFARAYAVVCQQMKRRFDCQSNYLVLVKQQRDGCRVCAAGE